MACQGEGCMAGTWTGGPCSGMSGLHACMDLVLLPLPSEFCTLCDRTAASPAAGPSSIRLLAASVQSSCACSLTADATPRSTPNNAQRSMVPPLHSIHGEVTPLFCLHLPPELPNRHRRPPGTLNSKSAVRILTTLRQPCRSMLPLVPSHGMQQPGQKGCCMPQEGGIDALMRSFLSQPHPLA